MDWIALEHARPSMGTGNGLKGMILIDGLLRADAGQDTLSSPGKSGKEMRLDKSFRQQQIAFHGKTVDTKVRTRWQAADVHEINGIERVVDANLLFRHNLLAEHALLFLNRGGTMESRGDENGNIGVRGSRPDLFQQNGQSDSARYGTRMIAGDQHHLAFSCRKLTQAGRPYGVGKRLTHKLFLTGGRDIVMQPCGQDSPDVGVRNKEFSVTGVIRNRKCFHAVVLCGKSYG